MTAPPAVPSIGRDDGVAESPCAGALNAVSLHGFDPENSQLPAGTRLVLVGDGDEDLRELLLQTLDDVGLPAEAAGPPHGELDGNNKLNIVNRTKRGMGAQLELSEPLRATHVHREHPAAP
jgi:phage replication-related protein YjqB (UPF0714/DUF867 family)